MVPVRVLAEKELGPPLAEGDLVVGEVLPLMGANK